MSHALIVDDSKTARYALRQLLARHQFRVDMVESAEEALDYLNSQRPDLIFMDHMMPGMDGFQAVKAIKSSSATHDIPIVMYTSTQDGVYFGQARALGAADVILKPATPADLAGVLTRLEQQGQLGAAAADTQVAPPSEMVEELPSEEPPPEAPVSVVQPLAPVAATTGGSWRNVIVIALVVLAAVLGWGLLQTLSERDRLAARNAQAIVAIEWALNQQTEFAFGDAPFGAVRVQQLRELLEQLQGLGFRGTVRIESHVGEFCTVRDERRGGWMVAPGSLPLTECGALGQSDQQAQRTSEQQTAAFRRFLTRTPALRSGDIRIELTGFGAREPLLDYPADPDVSAGVWNRIAQRNQRLVYR